MSTRCFQPRFYNISMFGQALAVYVSSSAHGILRICWQFLTIRFVHVAQNVLSQYRQPMTAEDIEEENLEMQGKTPMVRLTSKMTSVRLTCPSPRRSETSWWICFPSPVLWNFARKTHEGCGALGYFDGFSASSHPALPLAFHGR